MGDVTLFDSMLSDGLNDAFSGKHSGWHTEDLVTKKNISRDDQDRWALRSQQRFGAAQAEGRFVAEIAVIEVPVVCAACRTRSRTVGWLGCLGSINTPTCVTLGATARRYSR